MTALICEYFNCTPDVAARQDVAECKRIMRLRSYAETKRALDAATKDNPAHPAVTASDAAIVYAAARFVTDAGHTLAEGEALLRDERERRKGGGRH